MNNFPSGTVHKSIQDLTVSMNFSGEVQLHNKKCFKRISRLNSHLHTALQAGRSIKTNECFIIGGDGGCVSIPSVLEAELSLH